MHTILYLNIFLNLKSRFIRTLRTIYGHYKGYKITHRATATYLIELLLILKH